jgi:5'-3' exonuclease
MRYLFVDGSNLASRSRHALAALARSDGHPTGVIHGFLKGLSYVKHQTKCNLFNTVIFWDKGRSKWRQEFYPPYKQNRKPGDPVETANYYAQVQSLQEQGLKHLEVRQVVVPNLEADDAIAVFARKLAAINNQVIIYSGDRDMHQLINQNISVFDPAKDSISEPEALKLWGLPKVSDFVLFKALIGDDSDNIDGVKGIGEVKAREFILNGGYHTSKEEMAKKVTNRNKKGILSLYEEANKEVVKRNIMLMDLPCFWEHTYYTQEQIDQASAQFVAPLTTDKAAFFQYLERWELKSIIETLHHW